MRRPYYGRYATPRQARSGSRAGFPVLPLHSVTEGGGCTCGNSECESRQAPFAPLAPHGLKDATVDLDVIRGWFGEHYWLNYGVVTDKLLVIDIDPRNGGDRPGPRSAASLRAPCRTRGACERRRRGAIFFRTLSA